MADEKKDQDTKASGKLDVGSRVKFYPSHNKALELVGTVTEISQGLVTIEAEADGKIIEVEQMHSVPLADVRLAAKGDTHRHVGDRG